VNTHRPLRRLLPFLVAASAPAWSAHAQTVTMPAEVVTAARTAQPAEQVAVSVRSFDAEALRVAPTATLDGALRSVPGFSLFRRSDSLTANPTAQGVSLRGLGPSGASRSLVLLDGVPLNDPFGGWVAWTKVPRESLARIEVVPGGGASAWGNAALGGVVQILTQQPSAQTTAAKVTLGDFGTRSAELAQTQPGALGTFDLAARVFATDGFALVAPERRGPIDIAARSRHTLESPLAPSARQTTRVERRLSQLRGAARQRHALPAQRHARARAHHGIASRATVRRLFVERHRLRAGPGLLEHVQRRERHAHRRDARERPVFRARESPRRRVDGHVETRRQNARTSFGADARAVRGETREYFTFVAGISRGCASRADAGKRLGLFVLHERLAPRLRATVGARSIAGARPTATAANPTAHRRRLARRPLRRPRRHGFSPSAGLVWTPNAAWRLRASAQQAFRRPTLNELYRPFRQGANVTEANAALRTERVK
jgi:outer membrane receptor protein involved in Fe transport